MTNVLENVEFHGILSDEIKNAIMLSKAVSHPYLEKLAAGELPNMKNAIRDYVSQYQNYSSRFTEYLRGIIENLPENEKVWLQENLNEELGFYKEEEIKVAGIRLEWVDGIKHSDLFRRFSEAINAVQIDPIVEVIHWRDAMLQCCCKSLGQGLGALGLGTEMIVSTVYRSIFSGIQKAFPDLEPKDSCFFPLHMICDDDHAQKLMDLTAKYCEVYMDDIEKGINIALKCREKFWDAMLQRAEMMQPDRVDLLYDKQASNWARKESTCLSDFTARPKIFDICEPLRDLTVLDIGCGDGYCSRILMQRGVKRVVGIDISEKMIQMAVEEEHRNPMGIDYIHGDATSELIPLLKSNTLPLEYDLVVAVFLFNYVTIEAMTNILKQAKAVLKPGGKLVFSVPHP